jgi:Rhodopirellula transposase DDE domain
LIQRTRDHLQSRRPLGVSLIMDDYPALAVIQRRYQLLQPVLDERLRRLWAAAEALALGEGGVAVLAGATGLSRTTIRSGILELQGSEGDLVGLTKEGRVRRPGAGRKAAVERDETLKSDLETVLESSQEAEGRLLGWTCKSIRSITEELAVLGHQVSYRTIGNQLHRMGYRFSPSECYKKFSLVARRDQYRRISRRTAQFLARGEPVVSLGVADEATYELVVPDSRNAGLGASLLRHWWQSRGLRSFPGCRRMMLLTDTTGLPSGDRATWAPLLQPLAAEVGLVIEVAHFPPGARRWRWSTREVTGSFSMPAQTVEMLMVELDLILAPEGGLPRISNPEESVDDFWNYRIGGNSGALSE